MPPPLPSWEGAGPPSALPAPNAAGFLGALLAAEQRAPGAGGNSPRHGLRAAGAGRWGDAEIDRQIALPWPAPAPAPTFPTRRPPGVAQTRRAPTPAPQPADRALFLPTATLNALWTAGSLLRESDFGKGHTAPCTLLCRAGSSEETPPRGSARRWAGELQSSQEPRGGALALRSPGEAGRVDMGWGVPSGAGWELRFGLSPPEKGEEQNGVWEGGMS